MYENYANNAVTCSICNENIPRKDHNTKGMIHHLKNHPAQKRKYDELKKEIEENDEIQRKKQRSMRLYAKVCLIFLAKQIKKCILGSGKSGKRQDDHQLSRRNASTVFNCRKTEFPRIDGQTCRVEDAKIVQSQYFGRRVRRCEIESCRKDRRCTSCQRVYGFLLKFQRLSDEVSEFCSKSIQKMYSITLHLITSTWARQKMCIELLPISGGKRAVDILQYFHRTIKKFRHWHVRTDTH